MCRRRLNTTKAPIQTKDALSVRHWRANVRLLHSMAPFRRTTELSEAGGRSAFRVYAELLELGAKLTCRFLIRNVRYHSQRS